METLGGIKYLDMQVENGKVKTVKVDMGVPKLTSELPENPDRRKNPGIYRNRCGNPHAVYYVDDVDCLDLEKIGPAYEMHERFPDRVNSEFIRVIDRTHLQMRVWERGSWETWACGTGATASAVASMMLGLVEDTVEVS